MDALQASIDAFANNTDAYAVTKEGHAEGRVYSFRLKLNLELPMTQWALMIGDCLHNARSALDHLYWALVLMKHPNGGPKNDWRAGFPICIKPERFKKAEVEEFVGPRATAIIEGLQPFQNARPEDTVLAFLHKRDITDKHRLLIPSVGLIEKGRAIIKRRPGYPPPDFKTNVFLQDSLHDGAVLATTVIQQPERVMDVNLEVTRLSIFFDRGGGLTIPVPKALAQAIAEAEGMPGEFSDFFPSHGSSP